MLTFATVTTDTELTSYDIGLNDAFIWLLLSASIGLTVLVTFAVAALWLSERDRAKESEER